jgi:Chlorophyll A-B binding protein
MLGVAGCLVPELLTKAGVADLPVWSEAGKGVYYTDAVTLFLIQGILMNWVEVLRWQDIKNPGSVNADPIHNTTGFGMPYKLTSTEVGYPGSRFFDPLGMSANPAAFAVNKVKEIKNGRCVGSPPQVPLARRGRFLLALQRSCSSHTRTLQPRHGRHGWLLHPGVCDEGGTAREPVRAHR